MLNSLARAAAPEVDRSANLRGVYEAHKGFVWACLQRFGTHPSELEDLFQEVFLVVHRRLSSFDTAAPMRPWLFGIAMRVASNHRRRAYRRRERPAGETLNEMSAPHASPETLAAESEARRTLSAILDRMPLDKRAVFVMFEVEGLDCQEIADQLGVPVGTVYSRLHAARKTFEKALRQHRARSAGGQS
jgi:RNA polymerase sigma-70 factor (ECF subfamily)